MPSDENAPLLAGLVRAGAPRRAAKSSKQRGSILTNVDSNRVSVFDEHETYKSGGTDSQADKGIVRDERIGKLETALKDMRKENERKVINDKTMNDRMSTIEGNFVELRCELTLSTKPFPSTPARSRAMYDSAVDSPIVCPSLTGAEENTTFATPPVPALQRKLFRMSMQGKGISGLRSELRYEDLEDESTILGDDSMEFLTEDRVDQGQGHGNSSWEDLGPASLEHVVFNKRCANPPPTFDPDVSLGDVSMIEGIYDDAARAGAYLDSQQTGASDATPSILAERFADNRDLEDLNALSTNVIDPSDLEVETPGPKVSESMSVDATVQTEAETDSFEIVTAMNDAIMQTDVVTKISFEAGVQASPNARSMYDAATQTINQDSTPQYEAIVRNLSDRVDQLERLIAARDRPSTSVEHEALVDAYRGLLRAEAEKRLDLVAIISSFKEDLASCKEERPQVSTSEGLTGWSSIVSHLGVAFVVCCAARAMC